MGGMPPGRLPNLQHPSPQHPQDNLATTQMTRTPAGWQPRDPRNSPVATALTGVAQELALLYSQAEDGAETPPNPG